MTSELIAFNHLRCQQHWKLEPVTESQLGEVQMIPPLAGVLQLPTTWYIPQSPGKTAVLHVLPLCEIAPPCFLGQKCKFICLSFSCSKSNAD